MGDILKYAYSSKTFLFCILSVWSDLNGGEIKDKSIPSRRPSYSGLYDIINIQGVIRCGAVTSLTH